MTFQNPTEPVWYQRQSLGYRGAQCLILLTLTTCRKESERRMYQLPCASDDPRRRSLEKRWLPAWTPGPGEPGTVNTVSRHPATLPHGATSHHGGRPEALQSKVIMGARAKTGFCPVDGPCLASSWMQKALGGCQPTEEN